MKHYVINLKRRPDKRAFWLGWNMSRDFPIEDMTFIEAVDANSFVGVKELAEFMVEKGFSAYEELVSDPSSYTDPIGFMGLRVTHDLLLKKIAGTASPREHQSVIWNDDEVLINNYDHFQDFASRIALVEKVDVVGVPTDPHRWIRGGMRRWENREKRRHPTLPLYRGCVGSGYNQCMILNSQGAAKLLKVGAKVPGKSYLALAYTHLYRRTWAWQSALSDADRLTRWVDFFPSDLHLDRKYERVIDDITFEKPYQE